MPCPKLAISGSFSLLLLLIVPCVPTAQFSLPLSSIEQIRAADSPAVISQPPVLSPRLAGGLRHAWLLRPDPEWQRRMEQLLGNTNQLMLMNSGESPSSSSSSMETDVDTDVDDVDDGVEGRRHGGRMKIGGGNNIIRRLEARKNGPNDSFLAAIKQILLSMH